MKIIDSHVHFWNPEQLHYDWLGDAEPIKDAHLPLNFSEAIGDLDVQGLVFVEADCRANQRLEEVTWVESLAHADPRIQGIVAAAPMETGDAVVSHLESLSKSPIVKGVRRLIQAEPLGFSTQAPFIEAIRLLPQFGLSFDLCIKHQQFPDILTLVESCPDTSFILDHIGKPGIADSTLDPWREHMKSLSSLPNVIGCKLSGLITEANWETWTADDLRPYLEHAIDCFGTNRVLYGSDWPVSVLAGGYQRWWHAFATVLETLDLADQAKITGENAQRIYAL